MVKNIALSLLLALPAGAQTETLDGSKWKAQQKGILGTLLFWRTDVLTFDGGTLSSPENTRDGFVKFPYTVTSSGAKSTWTASATNAAGDKIDWKASWSGEKMKGTVTYNWKDGRQKKIRWKAYRLK